MSSYPAWSDAVIARFTFRVGLFTRRGLAVERAEQLADQLSRRDHDRDDRRMCIECAGLQRPPPPSDGRPQAFPRCGPMSRASANRRPVEPAVDVLQRCPHFNFSKP